MKTSYRVKTILSKAKWYHFLFKPNKGVWYCWYCHRPLYEVISLYSVLQTVNGPSVIFIEVVMCGWGGGSGDSHYLNPALCGRSRIWNWWSQISVFTGSSMNCQVKLHMCLSNPQLRPGTLYIQCNIFLICNGFEK